MPEETRETEQDPNPESVTTDDARGPYATTAQVRAGGVTDQLLALARTNAADPSIFDEHPPFFWSVLASNSKMDSYSTRMHKSTLQNFANDATAGVSFQNSHKTRELGFGQTLLGRFIGAGGNGVARMEADVYTIPGYNANGVLSDDLIRGIRSGLIKDVSVGFTLGPEGRYVCDLCQRDLSDCYHYPGVLYPKEEKAGSELVVATATIHDAHLSEISAVYDGATPGAGVLKAQRAAEAGTLDPKIARQLETQYRIKLPAAHHSWAGADLRSQKEADMPENDTRAPDAGAEWTLPAAERERYRTLVTECGLKPDAPPAAIVEALRSQIAAYTTERDTAVTERDELKVKLADAEPRAADGDLYRNAMVDETWSEYVRAGLADGAKEADQKVLWQRTALPELKKVRDAYAQLASARLQGGRLTTEGEPPLPATPTRELPLAAYRV